MRERGFTLIELMIVVAIVAVLAAVGVYAYSRHVKKGRLVKAREIIGRIQSRQEAYFQNAGTYCNASGGATCSSTGAPTFHPASMALEPKTWNPSSAGLGAWDQLGVRIESGSTYFSFASAAGVSSDNYALRGDAATLGLSAGVPWYYVEARADMDGNGSPYTQISVTNLRRQPVVKNEGQ